MAQLTNPDARFVGISLNTSALSDADALALMAELEVRHGLPVDPFRQGVGAIADKLAAL
jgi:uncharacterized NAD-dependent epimerase/dehydratase family protein